MSYTDPPATDKDWVRFLIGDTDPTSEIFSDTEITAVISEQTTGAGTTALKYYAAASLLASLKSKFLSTSKGKGITEKQVSKLRIKYGFGASLLSGIENQIKYLKMEGARRLEGTTYYLQTIGTQISGDV